MSVATLVLSPEDLLLHLALQLAEAGGFVGQVRTLCDIGATCWRYGEAIDWWALGTRATTYQVGKALYYCLRLARELVGADVPAGALTELRARFGQLPLEERFLAAVARRALLAEEQATGLPARFYRLGMHLLATRRARDGVTVAWRLLARAGQGRLRRLGRRPGLWPPHVAGAGDSGESALRPQQTPARPTSPREHPSHSQGEVAVTYDQNQADGVGAQLQRIYGLYALSRALDIKYVHTPLGQVDYQGLMPLLAGRTDPDFATRYNAFFSLPSDDFDLDGCERLLVPYPNEKLVEHYRQHAAATGRPVLLRAHEPYGYTDRHPEAYQALRAVSPYRDFRPEGPIRICIHVRRGDSRHGPRPAPPIQRVLPARVWHGGERAPTATCLLRGAAAHGDAAAAVHPAPGPLRAVHPPGPALDARPSGPCLGGLRGAAQSGEGAQRGAPGGSGRLRHCRRADPVPLLLRLPGRLTESARPGDRRVRTCRGPKTFTPRYRTGWWRTSTATWTRRRSRPALRTSYVAEVNGQTWPKQTLLVKSP